MTPSQVASFLRAQQRALRALEEASAFLRFQVEEINQERIARGQPPLPDLRPLRRKRMPEFDQQDAEILTVREFLWNRRRGPRVGDFVKMTNGELRRFAHHWGDSIQPTSGPSGGRDIGGSGSFFLNHAGHADHSGGLDSAIPIGMILPTNEMREAGFWFFHHNSARAHNDVNFKIEVRVYEVIPEPPRYEDPELPETWGDVDTRYLGVR